MAKQTSDKGRRERFSALQAAETDRAANPEPQIRARPANENDPGTAMMLARLRRQPSYTIYYWTFGLSLLWIFGWFLMYSSSITNPEPGRALSQPDLMRTFAVLVVPIAAFFVMAYFQWRAQQLRQVSEVLMQSAMRLIRPQDIAADGLTSIAQTVRHEVDLLVGGVEHAYQRASALEEIVHKEISAVERAFGANEDRIRGLVSGLESQRAALQQTSQLVGGEAAPLLSRLEGNTQNLGQVITLALNTFTRLEDGLKNSTSELARTIDEVSTRAAVAGQEIGGHSSQFERMSSMLINDFRGFSTQLQDYVQILNTAAGTLGSESRKFGSEVKGMETNLVQLIRQSADQLTMANAEVSSTIERLSGSSATQIKMAAGELSETVNTISDNISYHLKATSTEIAGLIERTGVDTAQRIEDSRAMVTQGLQNVSNEFIGRVAQSRTDLTSYVDQAAAQITTNFESATSRLAERINVSGSQILAGLDQSGNQFLSQLNASGSDYATRIEQASSGLSGQIEQHANVISSTMRSATEALTSTFDSTFGSAIEKFERSTTEFGSRIDLHASSLTESLGSASASLTDALETVFNNTMGTFDIGFNQATSRLEGAATAVADRINDAANLVVGQMQSAGSGVNDLLVSTSGTIAAHLKETTEIVNRQMQDSGLALSQSIETSGGVVTDRLISISGEFVDRLGTARDGMIQVLESTAGHLTDRLSETSVQLYGRLEQTATHINDQLESVALRINDGIDVTAGTVTGRVSEVTEKLTGKLDESSAQLGSLLDATETRLSNQLRQATSELTQMFTANTTHLDKVSTEFTEGLGQTAIEIKARFEQETGLLVDRIDKAATEFDAAANTSTTRIDEAHRKFSSHIETANTYLADQLASAAGEIDGRLESISMQLTGKLEVTGSRISERLEDVTTLVDRSIDKFNLEMEKMLSSRREILDTLVSDTTRRSQEVDTVLGSYITLIEESLNAAETRSRDIGRIVSEQTNVALGRLEEELKRLENTSSGQVNQAARVLREQHERALSSMNEMLSSTASDFQQTAQDMRITAQQVVKDIDAARNELKRAVIDLPEEARNNADAMRRVVADQISALNALSEVVRRQSGSLDFSGPGYLSPRSPPGSGSGKSEGASFSAPTSGTMSAPTKVAERTPERAVGLEGTMAQIAASVEALSGRAARPATRLTPPSRAEASSVAAREISAYTQKLHGASREIVEAMDDGLPRDIEKRYLAGDKGVYTQRLHDSRNKRTIKNLTARYGEERLLRSRINGYIRLFEKLLDTLSDVPGGSETIDDVLASVNGAVYLMMAEVSGRVSANG